MSAFRLPASLPECPAGYPEKILRPAGRGWLSELTNPLIMSIEVPSSHSRARLSARLFSATSHPAHPLPSQATRNRPRPSPNPRTMPKEPNRHTKPRHDAAYKSFFSRESAVKDTLRLAARDLSRHLDFATLKRLPASFVTERLGQRHADMLWKALTVEGSWLYVFVLLEFQSTVDRRMALRMMEYTVRILRGLDKEDLGPAGEHPPILPVVIYNGERRWTAATDVRDLFAPVTDELLGYLPRHRYLLIEVQSLHASERPSDNVLSLIASLEQARSPEQFEESLAQAAGWLENATDRELAKLIRAWAALVLVQRLGDDGIALKERLWEEEGTRMTTLIERARKWGEERDQQWLEQGLEKGLRKGIRRGRLEGERGLVLRMAARRFGPGSADDLAPVLDGVSDSDRVAAIAAKVFECETANELIEWARRTLAEDQAD